MPVMKVDGRCLCGSVTFEAHVDPATAAICHCTDCQQNSGTAYGVVVRVVDNQFTCLSGTIKSFVKTADSGNKRALGFCPECGTRIFGRPVEDPKAHFSLRVGNLNQREQLVPQRQIWCRSAQPWTQDLSGIPKFATRPNP
ncbi:MAG: GFA family protein [Pseudomonadota bacterium]